MKKLASATDRLWYKDAIIYELHVRAFADSNGDGIGDFQGLISRLDYLQDLGVSCIWLLPFFPSPLRDDGYDIANYVDVNPSYGTLSDFKAFLDAAHQRNMQVMIELVINHTSDQHPWFKTARLAPLGSPERDMYVWSSTDQPYKDARIIFTDTEKSNWTWDETAKAFYWHRFFSHQPDLNFDNPLVLEEVLKAMRFWLDLGVDGLRMDAIPYLCERDGTSCENLPETHAIIRQIRATIEAEYENRLILAEANQWPADVRPYFGDGDECHMAFHFPLMPRIYMALRQEDRLPITDIMAQTPPIPDSCQWGLFLRNHDELTLEMVTDDERDYMYFAYSADPRMRINVGIRRRLAPLVDNNRRRIELLNSLLLSFPGTPILYYGDEIGMGDNIYLGDRNGVRTPMQWTSDRNAGFSRCDPARLYFPVIMDPIYGYQVVNVEAQLSDQSSLLHWTRNMIALRKLFQVFGRGSLTFLNPENRKVLAYLRQLERSDGSQEIVLCVANLSRFAQPVSLDLEQYAGMQPVEMLGYVSFPTISPEPYSLTVAPYSFLWFELQPAAPHAELAPDRENDATPEIDLDEALAGELGTQGWASWFEGTGSAHFQSTLAAWLPNQRWFSAKSREIHSVAALYWIDLDGHSKSKEPARGSFGEGLPISPILLFLEVRYRQGDPDVYQIPLAVSRGNEAIEVEASQHHAVVASVVSKHATLVIYDASVREDVRRRLLELIEGNTTLPLHSPALTGSPLHESDGDVSARPMRAVFGNEPELAVSEGNTRILTQAAAVEDEMLSDAHTLPETPVVRPAPIDAQPGEAAAPPRSIAPVTSSDSQRMQPRESPAAGDATSSAGRLDARASLILGQPLQSPHYPSRLGTAEQSNTSVIYGTSLILKLFRRLQPGENPDVEIGRYLTEVARFPRIPRLHGEVSLTPQGAERITLAMLQELIPNEGDGWSWFLSQLESFLESVAQLTPPVIERTGHLLMDAVGAPTMPQDADLAVDAAALLGKRTAELHLALGGQVSDPAFAPEEFDKESVASDALRVEEQVCTAFQTLKSKLPELDEATAEAAIQVLGRRQQLIQRCRSLVSAGVGGRRIRIHGDLHLGQVLRTLKSTEGTGDFVFLDFEGEPAKPLAERRKKQSPLRDVAGMLRSFSYAAQSGANEPMERAAGKGRAAIGQWASHWGSLASASFLRGYQEVIFQRPDLLPANDAAQAMLEAYLLEKAAYELAYELNNRPSWVHIPLAGILAL
ncbi:MAG TPA: maltose alpha-D-glucosyltransferase [Terracidiphilus sp.]|nr:maltose alpha-D-glucosyltransferase [Terracidiphilus sp.]